jgi:hypothetical protein
MAGTDFSAAVLSGTPVAHGPSMRPDANNLAASEMTSLPAFLESLKGE